MLYPAELPAPASGIARRWRADKTTAAARRIRELLVRKLAGDVRLPAKSTVHAVLDRHGLVRRARARRNRAQGTPLSSPAVPNALWCADFKGEFKLGDGRYCYPLTVSDQASRYLLLCEALESTREAPVFEAFQQLFRERGLPVAIRSDNGLPFASPNGLYNLSRLSVWWLRLGIAIERIKPGHPQQNGRHERMHLTFCVITPAALNNDVRGLRAIPGERSVQAKDVVRNAVKEKLKRNEVVASMVVRLVRGVEIAQIAKTAGFDMLYIDLEHSSFSLDTAGQICLAALGIGITPMVRVPANTPDYISRVLDGGALGVIAPDVGSAEEARAVVKAAKYPPLGERGAGGVLPHLQYRSFPAAEANAALNDATMVIVQFESAAAVDRADEIAAVDGVDMVLIGVNDLLASLGLAGQFEHAKLREAYARAIAACRKHGKHVGVGGLSTQPKLAGEFVAMGARLVSTGTDIQFLLAAATEKASQVRDMPVR